MRRARSIQIVTPAPPASLLGNRITAERWARLLAELGEVPRIVTALDDQPCDVLIALHARRSAAAIRRCRATRPAVPVIVALTGTDLYRDLPSDPHARESLRLADRLIVLHPGAIADLPVEHRDSARVVVQSAERAATPIPGPADEFRVCVIGHLRSEKDPLRTALAARRLPAASRVRVVQIGAARDAQWERLARDEAATNPRYRWLGERPHAEALGLLAGADLHALTSIMEGGANALCEAIACGVPTVASRIPGSLGLLGSDYPGYFEVGDTAALTALLHRAETDAGFLAELRAGVDRHAGLVRPESERRSLAALIDEVVR